MDDIPKITFKPVQPTIKSESPPEERREEIKSVEVEEKNDSLIQKKKLPIGLITSLTVLLLLGIGSYSMFTQFVVWDDGMEVQSVESSSAYIPDKLPMPVEDNMIAGASDDNSSTVSVKGKITAKITGESGALLENGVIRLLNTAGKVIKEVDTSQTGIAIFDGIAAGSYKIEGGKKGENRVVSQVLSLSDGEMKDVTLSILLNTDVDITVTVKKSDGTAFADQSFTIRKIRSSEEPLDYQVTTNNFGLFTKTDVSPDNNWLLIKDGEEVGSFAVAPTGKNQTINVQTKSN